MVGGGTHPLWDVVLLGGHVYRPDGSIRPGSVGIAAGRIGALDDNADALAARRVIRADGCTILPGLIDLHGHLTLPPLLRAVAGPPVEEVAIVAAGRARESLRVGVTTVRDLGGYHGAAIALRDGIAFGHVAGPQMLAARNYVCMTGGHSWQTARRADGPTEVRRAAREEIEAGADILKIMCSGGLEHVHETPNRVQFSPGEVGAFVEEARAAGLPVAAHAHPAEAIKMAVRAGVRSIEHGSYLDLEAAQMMIDEDAFLVPTLAVYDHIAREHPDQQMRDRASGLLEIKSRTLTMAVEMGVNWGVGTDAGGSAPLRAIVDELQLICQIGVSRSDVLKHATSGGADLLGRADLGRCQVGGVADLIVIRGNPLQDLDALRRVSVTIRAGQVFEWDQEANGGAGDG